ncbi:homeobox domain-containing protein [Stagonosporopsis vannaccii]|nr:homeobox domain-containing protein [Stagonosporopsis vannaccii]
MEYLTLQDIPRRHCSTVHSHKMAPQSSERSVGHMAAVCDIYSDSPPSSSPPRLLLPPHQPHVCYAFASHLDSKAEQPLPSLKEISLPKHFKPPPHSTCILQEPGDDYFRVALEGDADPSKPANLLSATQPGDHETLKQYVSWCDTKATMQTHLQRSSPPLQPGEQNFPGKLPSFDEFVQTTIERTPPHTPSRRNESTENSPRMRPQFEDVAWSETKRRRVDTLGDIYARPSNASEYPPADPRRMSSTIDPALYHTDPTRARQHSAGPSHHRPSLPYPPASAPQHARHQSQPVAQGHSSYQQPPMHAHRMVVQSSYAQPVPQPGMMYERRQSYYQDPHMQSHAFPYDDRRESVYYANQQYAAPPPAGYEQSYYDVRFQQHVGVDHNAFNRKRRGNLPKEATNILKEWFSANRASPYPTEDQKLDLCRMTNLSLNQVSNWFINARRRAPQKEQRERESNASSEQ